MLRVLRVFARVKPSARLSGAVNGADELFGGVIVRAAWRAARSRAPVRGARALKSVMRDVTSPRTGFPAVRSASGSAALLRINARLGFQETYSEVRLVRQAERPLM